MASTDEATEPSHAIQAAERIRALNTINDVFHPSLNHDQCELTSAFLGYSYSPLHCVESYRVADLQASPRGHRYLFACRSSKTGVP